MFSGALSIGKGSAAKVFDGLAEKHANVASDAFCSCLCPEIMLPVRRRCRVAVFTQIALLTCQLRETAPS